MNSLQDIGGSEEDQVERGVDESGTSFLSLDLLKVHLRILVQPVGDLNDKVELEEVGHLHVPGGVLAPDARDRKEVALAADHLRRPHQRHQNEGQQLAGLVELGVLRLREVQFAGDFLERRKEVISLKQKSFLKSSQAYIENILLDNGVNDDGDEKVEEDNGEVLHAGGVGDDGAQRGDQSCKREGGKKF